MSRSRIISLLLRTDYNPRTDGIRRRYLAWLQTLDRHDLREYFRVITKCNRELKKL